MARGQQYKVLTLNSNSPDRPVTDIEKGLISLEEALNTHAEQGWHFAGVWENKLILKRS